MIDRNRVVTQNENAISRISILQKQITFAFLKSGGSWICKTIMGHHDALCWQVSRNYQFRKRQKVSEIGVSKRRMGGVVASTFQLVSRI